ncbi:MAG: EAL domain-containing protein, partial [Eubacterium sp.]|nr:EAL domain-containing protein [Eubacterium sp.]
INQTYHFASAARDSMRGKEGEYMKVFDQQILQEQLWKHKVEEKMEAALLNGEFQLYLQPKYHPVTEKILGAEALVRWISEEDGMIPPNRFIPVFEENGFITRLDDYMISEVAKLQSEWKINGQKQIPVSVNISRVHFVKEDLAEHICHLVDGYGADHALIELELTESAFFGNKKLLQTILKKLKMCGFCLAIDDFGAGYSSLNSLKDLPIDVLKLDMDFFRGEDTLQRGEIVVKETIRLAKALDMKIVAEGIEKKEQVEFLAEQDCDMIQGFYFAKPMPVDQFNQIMKRETQHT